jgi:deoxyribonuclease IV
MLIGAQIRNRDPIGAARERGAEAAQFFVSNPQAWRVPKVREDAEQLRASDIVMYVHSPYLINIASGNNRVRHPSRKLLRETCEAAANIGAAGVVVHGGYCLKDEDPREGFVRWRKALDELETEVPVLIENTAGGDNAMCRYLDTLEQLWEVLDGVDVPLGFCFDTCHAHAGGEPLETWIERAKEIVGSIDLVHVNDSKDPAGSGRDRHENLGKGQIDPDVLAAVVRESGAPVAIIETPGEAADHAADITWLRERL